MPKMENQSTDSMNRPNGVDAVGKEMMPIDEGQPAVPASKDFDGYTSDQIFSEQKRAVRQ